VIVSLTIYWTNKCRIKTTSILLSEEHKLREKIRILILTFGWKFPSADQRAGAGLRFFFYLGRTPTHSARAGSIRKKMKNRTTVKFRSQERQGAQHLKNSEKASS
jgi:hypothetical protein